MILAQLAPSIQEYVLFLAANNDGTITEPELRKIARDPRWDRQLQKFANYLKRLKAEGNTLLQQTARSESRFDSSNTGLTSMGKRPKLLCLQHDCCRAIRFC